MSIAESIRERVQLAISDGFDALVPALPSGSAEPDSVGILFVCRGNVCRSPTAEGIFRSVLARDGTLARVRVGSAGTHGQPNAGKPPHWRARAEARRHRLNLGSIRARQVTAADLRRHHYVFAMDKANIEALNELAASGGGEAGPLARIALLAEDGADILDPIGGPQSDFASSYAQIERAIRALVPRLAADGALERR